MWPGTGTAEDRPVVRALARVQYVPPPRPAGVRQRVAFDLETTGVDPFRDVPVSYALVAHPGDADVGRSATTVDAGLIDPGVPIPAGSTEIHHITDDMVAGAPDLRTAAEHVASALVGAWATGGAVVGMNVSYDLTLLDSVLGRVGLDRLEDRSPGLGPVYDVLVIDRTFDRYRKGKRRLVDLCRHYGVDLDADAAHDAAVDCVATLAVLDAMLERYSELAALSADAVSDRMGAWYRTWLGSLSDHRMRNGDEPIDDGQFDWPIHRPAGDEPGR